MYTTTQQMQQPAKHLPGYTGYRPQYNEDPNNMTVPVVNAKEPKNARIPGYCGYIPGVKAENVFGESYGKSSGQSGRGEIQRGFDQDPQEKFRTVAQGSFQNQREVYAKIRAQANQSPVVEVRQPTIDDVPRHVHAKFFGLQAHEVNQLVQFDTARAAFYGEDSSRTQQQQQSIQKPKQTLTLSFQEAKAAADALKK